MLKSIPYTLAVVVMTLLARGDSADACGFKRLNMPTPPSYLQVHQASARGKIFIYGDAADKRLEYALKRSGHLVKRTSDETDARRADVVISDADCMDVVQENIRGTTAVLVVVLKGGEGSPGGAQYVIHTGDGLSSQVATLDEAVRNARR